MSNRTLHVFLIAIVAALVSAGCGEAVEPTADGEMELTWEVSPRGCEAAGVQQVQVDLEYEQGVVTEKFPCQKRAATIGHLTPANYTLQLWGLDKAGDSAFGSTRRDVTVHGGETTSPETVRLTAQPGELRVSWRLKDGVLCGSQNIDQVELTLYDMQDVLIREKSAACTNGQAMLGDVPPGTYQLEIRDASGESGFRALTEVQVERGKATEAEVVLSPEDN